ncbi:MAG: hypothetical protein RLY86_3497 [Pseudomonadota bacterium]|jgi:single-stranded DNA-binding protein
MLAEFELIGRVARVTDLSGRRGATQSLISLATTRSWRNDDGAWEERTSFHTVTVYQGFEWVGEKLGTGDLVRIRGDVNSWSQEMGRGDFRHGVTLVARQRTILAHPRPEGETGDETVPDPDTAAADEPDGDDTAPPADQRNGDGVTKPGPAGKATAPRATSKRGAQTSRAPAWASGPLYIIGTQIHGRGLRNQIAGSLRGMNPSLSSRSTSDQT